MKSDKEPDARKKSGKPTDQPKPRRVYARPPVDGTDVELEAWAKAFYEAIMNTKEGTTREGQEGGETP